MKDKRTQGRRLISLLKQRYHSGLELQLTGISLCWHKRVAECLAPFEVPKKVKGSDGRLRYRVVAATKWTA